MFTAVGRPGGWSLVLARHLLSLQGACLSVRVDPSVAGGVEVSIRLAAPGL